MHALANVHLAASPVQIVEVLVRQMVGQIRNAGRIGGERGRASVELLDLDNKQLTMLIATCI